MDTATVHNTAKTAQNAPSHSGLSFREFLGPDEWLERKKSHENRISVLIDDYLEKRSRQIKDPVIDFLFEYYAFRPSRLKRWSPGFGVVLKGKEHFGKLELSELKCTENEAWLDPMYFPDNRRASAGWMLGLLENTAHTSPSFGCFGMHEWAMVYRSEEIRHEYLSLRMPMKELAEYVESRPLVCTHFDAYRFFTEEARPLNKFDLKRNDIPENEQPGCLHTNMDLYKWAFKMYPWISSDTIGKAFELALEARYIDMKASPYDLREYGLEPIKIETEEGRMEYLEQQKDIYHKSRPVREQLLGEYRHIAKWFGIKAY